MKLPEFVIGRLRSRSEKIAASRDPDFVIGTDESPYLRRWFVVPRNRFFNVYLHHFLRSDDDRALHDHMYWNVSVILKNQYTEHTINQGGVNVRKLYPAGDLKFRGPRKAHRIELTHGDCWSLFITGPRVREWGFHCPSGWRHWRDFTKPGKPGEMGRGCEE